MKERLLGVGLVGLIVLFVVGRAATNHKPSIVDIVGQSELEATIETIDPLAELDQKVIELDRRPSSYITTLDTVQASVNAYLPPDNLIDDEQSKALEDLSRDVEQLRKDQLAVMKQSEEPSKAPPDKTQLAKELTFVYGDSCIPCDQWKVGPDREQIAAECHIVPVYVGDLPPEARPESLPAYTLQVDGLRARHRGYLTFQRFKDMERAILEKRRSK